MDSQTNYNTSNNVTVATIGMARSGTSFVCHWLERIGIKMGEEFLPADDIMNEKGFYEDLSFLKLQSIIEHKNNLSIDNLITTQRNKITFGQEEEDQYIALLHKKNKSSGVWGWKVTAEPKYIWTDFYYPLLTKTLVANKVLVVGIVRDFQACIESCMRVTYLKRKKKNVLNALKLKYISKNKHANRYLKQWIASNEEILNFRQSQPNIPCIILNAETLLLESRQIFDYLQQTLGFSNIQYVDPNGIYDIAAMNRPANVIYSLNQNLKQRAEDLYSRLCVEMKRSMNIVNAKKNLPW
ncbi:MULTISPECIES: hypothetical protein [Chitinophagaceae]